MTAISGTRRAMKEMADGTIRVQIDIDPSCRANFLSMFGNIDMPVALAPLVADFDSRPNEDVQVDAVSAGRPKGGELAKLAGRYCAAETFQEWCEVVTPEEAAHWIRETCDVHSRAELDHDEGARNKFHTLIRLPYLEWLDQLRKGEVQG